ncbi:MAG: peptide-methionine (R)-S-oxide reductase MsrB [Candidatus Ancillula sp.]|jgi:peptide methionine sulfoxide reductase msrA/msrB|nr:peptide-methionine (R)-S-oxide reductase MsrB [Candidatus Ancillula sp.]
MLKNVDYQVREKKVIYFAGGCFWGVEAYFSRMLGVLGTEVGFVDIHSNFSDDNNITIDEKNLDNVYEQVCEMSKSGLNNRYIEAVKVEFDSDVVSKETLISRFGEIIDLDKIGEVQGPDQGFQYKTGYWDNATFIPAGSSHQDYLLKNPQGYCHIPLEKLRIKWPLIDKNVYKRLPSDELKKHLSDEQYKVTQLADTEIPFTGEYEENWQKGIYVDITSGEPLFLSNDKFQSGCGWPAFSQPIGGVDSSVIEENRDNSIPGRERVEVRSSSGNSHLGHVFRDGPEIDKDGNIKKRAVDLSADQETVNEFAQNAKMPETFTGLRYCINSAALRFVPKEDMERLGYGFLKSLVR